MRKQVNFNGSSLPPESGEITAMYLEFYGVREEPFGDTPDPRFLYASPGYQEAQATLEYGISSGRGFTALIAQPGMGKTTLLFDLLERYSQAARTAFVFLTQCDSREFLRYLMSELEGDSGESDIVRLHEQFGQLLAREAQAGRKVIAVVDEAHNLDVSVLETVRLLSDFETPRAKLLHIILAGQPELADRLNSPALLQLRQRISHLVRLEPLSAAEVSRYINHRLNAAGYSGGPLFSDEALTLIVERSQGIPRVINNLCCNALLLGFAKGEKTLGAEILEEVCADLDFEAIAGKREAPAAAAEDDIAAVLEQAKGQAMEDWEASEAPAAMAAAAPADAAYFPSWPDGGLPEETPPAAGPSSPARVAAVEAATASAQAAAGIDPDAAGEMASMEMSDLALQRMLDQISKEAAASFFPEEVPPPDPGPDFEQHAATVSEDHSNGAGEAAKEQVDAESATDQAHLNPVHEEVPPPGPGPDLEQHAATISENRSNGAGEAAKEQADAERPQGRVEVNPANQQVNAGGPKEQGDGEAEKAHVDVEALAADCALFGMEGRRWKRPAANAAKPFSTPGPAMRRNAVRLATRRNGPRAVATAGVRKPVQPAVAPASVAQAPGAQANQPARGPASVDGKLWPARPTGDARRRRNQRNLYLAAAGSALLVLILIWLLSSSAPSATSDDAANGGAAPPTATQVDASSDAAANDLGAVLDVTEEAPTRGEDAGARETRPAVVMRANHGEELLYRVDPVYPAAARANGIQGPVVLDATIGDHGFLRHIRVLNGDPLLADAVLDAVRGWRYQPKMEQGRPQETETRIVVNFRLAAPGSSAQSR